jgi:hypothetical protein
VASNGRWRFVPLVSALAVYGVAILTFGLGFLLFPAAVALNVFSFRRTARPRGFVFWLGTLATAVVTAAGLLAVTVIVAAFVSDELI